MSGKVTATAADLGREVQVMFRSAEAWAAAADAFTRSVRDRPAVELKLGGRRGP